MIAWLIRAGAVYGVQVSGDLSLIDRLWDVGDGFVAWAGRFDLHGLDAGMALLGWGSGDMSEHVCLHGQSRQDEEGPG